MKGFILQKLEKTWYNYVDIIKKGDRVMEEKQIEKLFKPTKALLITSIILIVISIPMFMYVAWKESNEVKPEAINYRELFLNYTDNENSYVKVTAQYIAPFAEKDDEDMKYYYVQDEEGYIFIAKISDETMEKVRKAYDEQKENFSYNLEGYIFNIPEDVKQLAMSEASYYFEGAPTITEETYEDYFGKTYLNEGVTPDTELNGYITGGAVFLGGIGVAFFIWYIVSVIRVRKYTRNANLEDVKYELQKSTVKCFPKETIYLTDKYIVSKVNGLLRVNEYEDFVWIYNLKAQQYGHTVNIFLTAKTKNKKQFHIATSLDENRLMQIMSLIKEKNPEVLIGFTDENKEEYKKYIKNQK